MLFTRNYIIYLLFLLFFLFSLTSNFSAPHDSIKYLVGFESGKNLLHPHHLLYHITTYWIFHLFKLIVPGISNHYLIETISALWGAGVLLIVNLILRKRLSINPFTAFLATCLVAFSYGIWFYSANIEVYMPSLFFILLLIYLITKTEKVNVGLIILLHGIAILFHQVNIIFAPVIIWKFWTIRREFPLIRSISLYTILGGLGVLSIYLIIGTMLLNIKTASDLVIWMKGYSTQSEYWFPIAPSTAINAIFGFGHALIGAHFMFKVNFVENYLNSKFYYHSLNDELYLVKEVSPNISLLLLVLTCIFILLYLTGLIKSLICARTMFRTQKEFFAPLSLTFFIYAVFFFFWMPENLEFWLLQSVLLWLFIIAGITKNISIKIRRANQLIGITAILLLSINYFGSIKWLKKIDNDYYYAKISELNNVIKTNDLAILRDPWIIKSYFRRYSVAKAIELPEANDIKAIENVNRDIKETLSNQKNIFIILDENFMHEIKNKAFIDSLTKLNTGKADIIQLKLSRIIKISP